MFITIFLLSIFPTISAILGVDVSQRVSPEEFRCLKDSGYQFVIVRVYRRVGIVDFNAAQTIKNARNVGFNQVYAYFLPCFSCRDAEQQVIEAIYYLKEEQADIDRLWLDIEGKWDSNSDANIQFVNDLIKQTINSEIKFGIYTSKYQWVTIMNNITSFSSNIPLWYIHYDNNSSFSDFQTFGGWTQPTMKQFIGDVKECGVVLNKNFS